MVVFRLKDPSWVVNAFNVDPLYLKHEHQGAAPDYRVNFSEKLKKLTLFVERSLIVYKIPNYRFVIAALADTTR